MTKKQLYKVWKCPVKGGTLYCRKFGEAPDSLLLVHGACVDADYFDETAAILSSDYSVYTFDRRGYGRNDPEEGLPLNRQYDDIRLLLQRIGNNCVIITHSAGFCPAVRCMMIYPGLVRGSLFYEPFALDILPGKAMAEKASAIRTRIREKDYFGAASSFINLIGPDERFDMPSASEIAHLRKNYLCFLKNEFSSLYEGRICANPLSGSNILIGLGDFSRSTVRSAMAETLSAKLGAQIIRYPSSHNCPRVHPKEFAEITGKAVKRFFER